MFGTIEIAASPQRPKVEADQQKDRHRGEADLGRLVAGDPVGASVDQDRISRHLGREARRQRASIEHLADLALEPSHRRRARIPGSHDQVRAAVVGIGEPPQLGLRQDESRLGDTGARVRDSVVAGIVVHHRAMRPPDQVERGQHLAHTRHFGQRLL